jgi:hypothetical protein
MMFNCTYQFTQRFIERQAEVCAEIAFDINNQENADTRT